jgi:hypothetical protein
MHFDALSRSFGATFSKLSRWRECFGFPNRAKHLAFDINKCSPGPSRDIRAFFAF